MSNKLLAGIIVIIVIFLAGIFFLFTKHTSSIPLPEQKVTTALSPTIFQVKTTTIQLTTSGFSPRTVTIKKDTGVVWINNSGIKATINSADHPTHRKFPELNLGEFLDKQSITHVFTKTGTYQYHNHYNPQESGTITVE